MDGRHGVNRAQPTGAALSVKVLWVHRAVLLRGPRTEVDPMQRRDGDLKPG